jgi:hypothetical protein
MCYYHYHIEASGGASNAKEKVSKRLYAVIIRIHKVALAQSTMIAPSRQILRAHHRHESRVMTVMEHTSLQASNINRG